MFKKLFLLLVIVGLLSACGGQEAEPSDTNAGSAVEFGDPTSEAEKSPEEKGLDILREQTDAFDNVPDDTITNTSEALCASLDKGSSVESVAWDAIEVYGPDAGALVALAVMVHCPEYESDLEAWFATSGA
jgi:hypothetical protein